MHLVKGNYGPHTGQPRAQEAPTSARGAGGGFRPSGMMGGIPDQDDVDGILQQVRKDVRAIQHTTTDRGRELDGRWCVKGHAVQIVINDGAVMALGGEPQLITFQGPGKFYINDQGTRVEGTLVGTEIHWSDGDIWIAMQDMGPADSAGGKRGGPAPKALSRNMSDATWDRPKTLESNEAKPRAQPKATVRGRYVFSAGAENQVLTGHDRSRMASSDFADDLASQFTPRKPGHTTRAPQLRSSSSHRQLQSEALPPHPATPECTDF